MHLILEELAIMSSCKSTPQMHIFALNEPLTTAIATYPCWKLKTCYRVAYITEGEKVLYTYTLGASETFFNSFFLC